MKDEILQEIKSLLSQQRVLSMGVLRDADPYVGLLPFVVSPDFSSVIVHASRLALHSAGLSDDAPFSILVHEPDAEAADPLQIPRLSMSGRVERLERDTRDYVVGRRLYIARFPESSRTFELGDFNLYRLVFESGRYVGGFARAKSLGPKDIRALGEADQQV